MPLPEKNESCQIVSLSSLIFSLARKDKLLVARDLQNHTPEAEADVSASKNNTKKAKSIAVEHFIGLGQQQQRQK